MDVDYIIIHKLKGTEDDREILLEAGKILSNDGLVVFPTETVYGIGANALSPEAVKKIFVAKGRPSDNPLIVHISELNMLELLASTISDIENRLMTAFCPGPLTMILKKTDLVPNEVTGGTNSVAVRMPSSNIARQIISFANKPIAAPSANKSGKPSGTTVTDIFDELKDHVDMFLDAGNSDIGLESTVVKVNGDIPIILRPGKITPEDIKSVVGHVQIDESVFTQCNDSTPVLSPGMKYRHYAPNCECILVEGISNELKVSKIHDIVKQSYSEKIVIICVNENIPMYKCFDNIVILPMGSCHDYSEISKNIFTLLRKAEGYLPKMVLIESLQKEGLGIALMNRLVRACGYNIIHC